MSDAVPSTPVDVRAAGHRRARKRRVAALLAVGLFSAGLALAARATDTLASLELDSVDARFSVRGTHAPAQPVVVVAIDDRTLRDAGPWPIRRLWHAQTIDALRADGARAILYDVQFTEPGPTPGDDRELIEATERARGKIVLVTTEVDRHGQSTVFGGEPVLTNIGARVGYGNVAPDEDGTLRRVSRSVLGMEAVGLVGAELATDDRVAASAGRRPWIDYAGPAGTFPHYSLAQIAQRRFESGAFHDKVVVVGATAASLQDVHATSVDAHMSGAEIQANVVATALAGFPLESASAWLDVALVLAFALLIPVALLRASSRAAFLVAAGGLALLVVGTQLAFQAGWVTVFIYPLLALLLAALGVLVLAVDSATRRVARL